MCILHFQLFAHAFYLTIQIFQNLFHSIIMSFDLCFANAVTVTAVARIRIDTPSFNRNVWYRMVVRRRVEGSHSNTISHLFLPLCSHSTVVCLFVNCTRVQIGPKVCYFEVYPHFLPKSHTEMSFQAKGRIPFCCHYQSIQFWNVWCMNI